MSIYGEEAPELAANNGGLLINIGTLTEGSVDNYLKAVHAYNAKGNPVVLDPVGAAATEVRRTAVKKLMSEGYFDLIKGNEAELRFISGHTGRQVGVDSGPSSLGAEEKAIMTLNLAKREREFSPLSLVPVFGKS
jgi:thiamine-phosphate diphosphorylase/hydroxyethylthiazole kinase